MVPKNLRCRPGKRLWLAWVAVAGGALPLVGAQYSSNPPGTTAQRNYYAPADFDVVDAAVTAATANAAGGSVPLVIRTDTTAADAVTAEFNAAFRGTRDAYLAALEGAFGTRALSPAHLDSPRFVSFRSEFQASNPRFPVDGALAQAWAEGRDGEPMRERLALALRTIMEHRLIGEIRPASTVYFVSLSPQDRIRAWGEASRHARVIDRGEIIRLATAGEELRRSLDMMDRGAAGYMAGLLRPNVTEDLYLTGLLLRERLGDQVKMRSFRRGELIVHQGDIIDAAAARALAQLERAGLQAREVPLPPSAAVVAPAPVINADPVLSPPPVSSRPAPASPQISIFLLAGSSIAALAGVGLILCWWMKRRGTGVTMPPWLERQPGTAGGSWRDALVPHLARELKNRLVQALFAQRQALLHNEAAASERVADLEARLAKLQPAIAEKIRGYEKRILALESELEEKDQETRDLIRAKLVLARKELDEEITRNRAGWN